VATEDEGDVPQKRFKGSEGEFDYGGCIVWSDVDDRYRYLRGHRYIRAFPLDVTCFARPFACGIRSWCAIFPFRFADSRSSIACRLFACGSSKNAVWVSFGFTCCASSFLTSGVFGGWVEAESFTVCWTVKRWIEEVEVEVEVAVGWTIRCRAGTQSVDIGIGITCQAFAVALI
jgi:hypothetical protein